jgi:hypothetical protein
MSVVGYHPLIKAIPCKIWQPNNQIRKKQHPTKSLAMPWPAGLTKTPFFPEKSQKSSK